MIPLDVVLAEKEGEREGHLVSLYALTTDLPSHATVVEIGCYRGDSLLAIAGALHGKGGIVYSFDPIFKEGSIIYRDMFAGTLELSSNLTDISNKILRLDMSLGDVVILPYSSEEALRWWREKNSGKQDIDLLFVDGEHTPEAVAMDCQWLDFVKPGGIAVFDDWAAPISQTVNGIMNNKAEWRMEYDGCTPHGPITHMTYFRKTS